MNDHDELSPPAEAPASLDPRPPAPDSIRAASDTLKGMITEHDADAVSSPTPAASAPPTVAEIPELEEVRRQHGEEGVKRVVGTLEQIYAHVAAERSKLPEVVKFAKQHGVTDEQIEHFRWHGTAAELRRWRDHWRAHEAAARRRATDRAERDEPETSRPMQPRRRRDANAITEAAARLEQTHRQRDAQRLIEKLLP